MYNNKLIITLITVFCMITSIVILYYHSIKYDRITTIKSFSEFDFSNLTPHDLVVFDIDETLIQPTDSYLIHRHSAKARFILSLFGLYNNEFNLQEYHEIRLKQANRILIEPNIIPTIQTLQKNKIPVIGCTAIKSGRLKTLQIDEWRYQDLKSLGFEGSWQNKIIMFDELPGRQLFYKGCIFTDLYEKGPALATFLKAISFKPKKIIFFDDCISYLESIRIMCDSLSIIFEGYLYKGLQDKNFDIKRAWSQLKHVAQYKAWISDEALTRY